jgi:acetyl-CoA carboxylase biotin carboxylase subunit
MFRRILIANRGEIALRVLRTAREMGLETVAVFSDPDRHALHVRQADLAVPLGGRLPSESYLDQGKLLKAAEESGAEAIHPGYGFLSENASFARRVLEAGLVWIGPPPRAIEVMGDKIESRRAMQAAGVPVVPGLCDPLADAQAACRDAEGIGYPIALKAAAGGGGKGIRIVRSSKEMAGAFRAASGEAMSAFGDGRLYLERYLDRPRHVEIQVLFDSLGGAVHLGERECSIQRRHQKLIEECPSVVVDAALRERMGAAALAAGRAVDYVGAGTVEFLWSAGDFHFLEMNTRLQVEHPVTEMVTGLDLVREQIRVAAGEPLGYGQEAVEMRGHAIEVRLNAEDVRSGYLPSTGVIGDLRLPSGPWVRVDSALHPGLVVGLEYDPMLAKLVVWGIDRPTAIARMRRALGELSIGGVRTSAPAAMAVLEHPAFAAGDFDTHFLEGLDLAGGGAQDSRRAALAAALFRHARARRRGLEPSQSDRRAWVELDRSRTSAYHRSGGRP